MDPDVIVHDLSKPDSGDGRGSGNALGDQEDRATAADEFPWTTK